MEHQATPSAAGGASGQPVGGSASSGGAQSGANSGRGSRAGRSAIASGSTSRSPGPMLPGMPSDLPQTQELDKVTKKIGDVEEALDGTHNYHGITDKALLFQELLSLRKKEEQLRELQLHLLKCMTPTFAGMPGAHAALLAGLPLSQQRSSQGQAYNNNRQNLTNILPSSTENNSNNVGRKRRRGPARNDGGGAGARNDHSNNGGGSSSSAPAGNFSENSPHDGDERGHEYESGDYGVGADVQKTPRKNGRSFSCQFEGCIKRPSFGNPGAARPTHCGPHKLEGMQIVIRRRNCIQEGCPRQPLYGMNGDRIPLACGAHRSGEMVNVTHRRCNESGCTTQPVYGWPVDAEKPEFLPSHCAAHKKEGMMSQKRTRCTRHRCYRRASFGQPGGQARLCVEHTEEGMVRMIPSRRRTKARTRAATSNQDQEDDDGGVDGGNSDRDNIDQDNIDQHNDDQHNDHMSPPLPTTPIMDNNGNAAYRNNGDAKAGSTPPSGSSGYHVNVEDDGDFNGQHHGGAPSNGYQPPAPVAPWPPGSS